MNHEQIRQQVSKQYKDKILLLESENRELKRFSVKNQELQEKCRQLQNQIDQQTEWIDRLLDYCNMNADDLEVVKAQIRCDKKELIHIDLSKPFTGFGTFEMRCKNADNK